MSIGKKLTETKKLPRHSLTREDYLEIFKQLFLARYFDIRLIKEKKRGRLRGTLYSSHNQEAVLVGTLYALNPEDWISPIHRDMPAFFLKDLKSGWNNPERKGISIEQIICQVFGKVDAPGRARDNWSHIGSREKKIIHSTSMLAGTIPVAAGVALSEKMRGSDTVVVTYNGEGSTARGDFHEAINYAAVKKLPMITVIENNMWAYGTHVSEVCNTPDVADRAKGFDIPGIVADGQDVFDVYDKMSQLVEYARQGNGPSILECKTYRAYGHGDHDDNRADKYRPSEDVNSGRSRDPLAVCREYLVNENILGKDDANLYMADNKSASQASDEDFPEEVINYLKQGVDFAINSGLPEAEEGGMWVFKE